MLIITSLDTIAALATAPAPSGVAVIRISGTLSKQILNKIFQSKKSPERYPRELIFGKFFSIKKNKIEVLDYGMAVFMPGPANFTGEDLAELHLHGNPLLVSKILSQLYSLGARAAEPGDFTKRAFLNGKIDLSQAEAISDLITSDSEASLKSAKQQLSGKLSTAIKDFGDPLRDALAEIEASIDFPEEDIKPETLDSILKDLLKLTQKIKILADSYNFGQIVKDGFKVLLCGPPNAGKSSLLNNLLGTKRAIVSNIAGTTRDLIEEKAKISEFTFVFCDSAGLTETQDEVEKIGIELAKDRMNWADLLLFVIDAKNFEDNSWREVFKNVQDKNCWLIVNKIDLIDTFLKPEGDFKTINISVNSGSGIDLLKEELVQAIQKQKINVADSSLIITNGRHHHCLKEALSALELTIKAIKDKLPLEFVSADLRRTLAFLDEIIGRTYTEDILGRIFSKFCIGK